MSNQLEQEAHEVLRGAIRVAAVTNLQQHGDPDLVPEVEAGILVDYLIVAIFDDGNGDHDLPVVLSTDGSCSRYRKLGLIAEASRQLDRT